MVDTNILVYATIDEAPKCDEARRWMQRLQKDGVQLCATPQIYREYLVVLTRGSVVEQLQWCEVVFEPTARFLSSQQLPAASTCRLAHLRTEQASAFCSVHFDGPKMDKKGVGRQKMV